MQPATANHRKPATILTQLHETSLQLHEESGLWPKETR
jgi:hypothetical protein